MALCPIEEWRNNKQHFWRYLTHVEICEGVEIEIDSRTGNIVLRVYALDAMQRSEGVERGEHTGWERSKRVSLEVTEEG